MKKILHLIAIIMASFTSQAQTQYLQDTGFEDILTSNSKWVVPVNNAATYFDFSNAKSGAVSMAMFVSPTTTAVDFTYQTFTNITEKYNCKLEFYIKCIASSGSSNDLFIVTLDSILNPKYTYSVSGLKSDSIALGANWNKIMLNFDTLKVGLHTLGLFAGPSVGGSPSKFGAYLIDDITFTTGYPTSINYACENNCNLSIYPTQINDKLNIDNITEQNCTATIINLAGQVVQKNILLNNGKQTLNTNAIEAGMYILQITNSKGLVINTSKIFKQ